MNLNHTAHDAWAEARQEFESRLQVALVLALQLEEKLIQWTKKLENEQRAIAA